jgi:hypothetical protein
MQNDGAKTQFRSDGGLEREIIPGVVLSRPLTLQLETEPLGSETLRTDVLAPVSSR